MARFWYKWRPLADERDPWNNSRDRDTDYGWLKKTAVAAVLFCLFYTIHTSDTVLGRTVDSGIHYALTKETDVGHLAEQALDYAERVMQSLDAPVFRRFQDTVSRPANPLLYMSRPAAGRVVAGFGSGAHSLSSKEALLQGIILETSPGIPIIAAAPGKVRHVADASLYGRMVIITHGSDIETIYGMLGEVLVREGDMVGQNQVIARSGQTSPSLLYFEVREKGQPIDPLTRVRSGFSQL